MLQTLKTFWRRQIKPFLLEIWEVAKEYPDVTFFWAIVATICFFL